MMYHDKFMERTYKISIYRMLKYPSKVYPSKAWGELSKHKIIAMIIKGKYMGHLYPIQHKLLKCIPQVVNRWSSCASKFKLQSHMLGKQTKEEEPRDGLWWTFNTKIF